MSDKPCPTCGRCPTCGHTPKPNPWQWWQAQPYYYPYQPITTTPQPTYKPLYSSS